MIESAILLFAAVAGYWVLERAAKQKGRLKLIGQFLGSVVIVASLLGVVCKVICQSSGKFGYCAYGAKAGKGWMCPMKGSSTTQTPSTSSPASGI